MRQKKTIEIMLLDDHPVILHGLAASLRGESGIRILGSFTTSQDLIKELQHQTADLVVLDYALGPDQIDGLSLIRSLKVRFPNIRLLVLSAQHNAATVSMAMRVGADGFIGKEIDAGQLSIAIRRVARGQTYLAADMKEMIQDHQVCIDSGKDVYIDHSSATPSGLLSYSLFTVREYEVIRCCLDGLSVTQIAEKFSRSKKTISTQKHSAFKKLGVRNDNELYKFRGQFEEL